MPQEHWVTATCTHSYHFFLLALQSCCTDKRDPRSLWDQQTRQLQAGSTAPLCLTPTSGCCHAFLAWQLQWYFSIGAWKHEHRWHGGKSTSTPFLPLANSRGPYSLVEESMTLHSPQHTQLLLLAFQQWGSIVLQTSGWKQNLLSLERTSPEITAQGHHRAL